MVEGRACGGGGKHRVGGGAGEAVGRPPALRLQPAPASEEGGGQGVREECLPVLRCPRDLERMPLFLRTPQASELVRGRGLGRPPPCLAPLTKAQGCNQKKVPCSCRRESRILFPCQYGARMGQARGPGWARRGLGAGWELRGMLRLARQVLLVWQSLQEHPRLAQPDLPSQKAQILGDTLQRGLGSRRLAWRRGEWARTQGGKRVEGLVRPQR